MRWRFYKSRLFWLGVPGLVFLLWAWWDSGGYDSALHWSRGIERHHLRVRFGFVMWVVSEEPSAALTKGVSVSRGELRESPGGKGPRSCRFDFPEPFDWQEDRMYRWEVLDARVALWVIVLGYVAAWLGVVWWWQRRKARVMSRLTEMKTEVAR